VNIAAKLHGHFCRSPCAAHGSTLKLLSPSGDARFPDALVRCGPADPRLAMRDIYAGVEVDPEEPRRVAERGG
jgi:hypothetical protein